MSFQMKSNKKKYKKQKKSQILIREMAIKEKHHLK
jgi:hypothetical protein